VDKLRAIKVFAAISKHGSLTEAARQIGTSLPTVVRTLSALEEDLGVRLFNRTTRRIALTEEGELYLAHCSKVLNDLSQVENALKGNRHSPEGLVKITAPVMLGEKIVTPLLCEILRSNPRLDIEISLVDRIVDMVEENVDIAIRIGHLDDSALTARHVGKVRLVACASPDYLKNHHTPKSPNELRDAPSIQFNGINVGRNWHFGNDGASFAVKTSGRFISNMNAANVAACVNGVGIGHFYSYQVAEHVRIGKLVTVLHAFEPAPVPVNLVYPHARLMSPRVQYVLKHLRHGMRTALKTQFSLTPG
jgi:DNA-binding transcriptional LysR family regulator